MVVNHSKTELILFTRKRELNETVIELTAGTSKITSVSSIRALGISIDRKLEWSTHINNLQRKFASLMSGLRIIARKLDQAQLYKVVTSQVFSILFYSSPVWQTTELSRKNLNRLESMHFSALRLVIKDYRNNINREKITQLTNRMPPKTWMKYGAANLAIKIIRDQTPTILCEKLMKNSYLEPRKPQVLYTYDSSHNKHGKKGYHNWITLIMKQIRFPWYGLPIPISDNGLRVKLKETFIF